MLKYLLLALALISQANAFDVDSNVSTSAVGGYVSSTQSYARNASYTALTVGGVPVTGGGGSSPTWDAIISKPTVIQNISNSTGSVTVTTINANVLAGTISATGLTSLTGLYGNLGTFGLPNGLSTTGVLNIRQSCTNSTSCGMRWENSTGQSVASANIDSGGTGGNLVIERGGYANQLVVSTLGQIGVGKGPNSALDVSGTISGTAIITGGLLTAANISATGNLTTTNLSASGQVTATNLTVTGIFSGTVVTYTTNVTNINIVTTTLGTIDENTISATTGTSYTLNTPSYTIANLTITANASLTLAGCPQSGYSRAVTIFTKQGGVGGFHLDWPSNVIWSGGISPTFSAAASAKDDFTLITPDNCTTWHGYQAGAGMN